LDAHSVLRGIDESKNAQVLFDPAKEQVDLPAGSVELGDYQSRNNIVVVNDFQGSFFFCVVKSHAMQRDRIVLSALAPVRRTL
jgi:hypothetical protein